MLINRDDSATVKCENGATEAKILGKCAKPTQHTVDMITHPTKIFALFPNIIIIMI